MKWSPFSTGLFVMVSFLEAGVDGHGSWAIHSSRNGLRLTLNGITVGRGADPDALVKDYEAFVQRMKKAKGKARA
jgi:hypothetical protein